jgi:hypothetical protein
LLLCLVAAGCDSGKSGGSSSGTPAPTGTGS